MQLYAEAPDARDFYCSGGLPGTREMVVHPSHIVVDTVRDDTVPILRVLHTARKWP